MPAKAKTTKVIISRRRDGNMNDVYVGCIGVDGKFVDAKIRLDTEMELDNNLIESIKQRQESVKVKLPKKDGGGEALQYKPEFLIEKV